MSTTTFGPSKKETVYDGPPLPPKKTNYGQVQQINAGPAYQNGTVYPGNAAFVNSGRIPFPPVAAIHESVSRAGRLFYYIAALSGLNTIFAIAGVGYAMAVGLGISRAFDGFLARGQFLGVIVFNGAAVALFALLGKFTRQGSKPSLITGTVLYGLDLVLLCIAGVAQHAPSVAVHGFFLFRMLVALKDSD